MILLTTITDKLQVITSAALAVDVHASFLDMTQADPPVVKGTTSGRQNTAISTAATTDILAAPAATTTRNARTLHVRNKSATTPVDVTVQFNQNATLIELHKATLQAGEALEYIEGVGFYVLASSVTSILLKILTADEAGQNVLTAQPWFPTTGGVSVAAATTYIIDGELLLTRAAGTVSHTTGLLFGGTATLTSIQYIAEAPVGDTDALLPHSRVASRVATSTTVKAASVVATEAISIMVKGILRVAAAGTFIPQYIFSAAPGGAPTVKANSYFQLTPVGSNTFASQGVWA